MAWSETVCRAANRWRQPLSRSKIHNTRLPGAMYWYLLARDPPGLPVADGPCPGRPGRWPEAVELTPARDACRSASSDRGRPQGNHPQGHLSAARRQRPYRPTDSLPSVELRVMDDGTASSPVGRGGTGSTACANPQPPTWNEPVSGRLASADESPTYTWYDPGATVQWLAPFQ